MLLRLSMRFASVYRKLLMEEGGRKFVNEAEKRLAVAKGVVAIANGVSLPSTSASSVQISYWQGIVDAATILNEKLHEVDQLNAFIQNLKEDKEMVALAKEDLATLDTIVDDACDTLAARIRVDTELDVLNKCQMEFTSGVGGTEAMLFTGELLYMYQKFVESKGWTWSPLEVDDMTTGGIRSALVAISGEKAYSLLRFEAGVHRVQRIPVTDKSRMHTSTASIIVLPEPEEPSVIVPPGSVKIETMRASGPGGQNINKRSTAVRITHKETGVSVHCMDERFQHMNIQIAYKRLAAILMQQKADKIYDEVMSSRKIQMGTRGRAEKIRTYNFQADRITDHRLHKSVGNVAAFMEGGEALAEMVDELRRTHEQDKVEDIVSRLKLD